MNVVSLPCIIIMYTSLFNFKSLDIEMGTVSFAILNINNTIRYFTNVTNDKIPVSLYNFSEETKKGELVIILIILFCNLINGWV